MPSVQDETCLDNQGSCGNQSNRGMVVGANAETQKKRVVNEDLAQTLHLPDHARTVIIPVQKTQASCNSSASAQSAGKESFNPAKSQNGKHFVRE